MYSTLHFLHSRLARAGLPADELFAAAGIGGGELRDPWPLLSHDQCTALARTVILATGNPAAGLDLSRDLEVRDLGPVGFALLCSASFAEARRISLRYRLLKDPATFYAHRLRDSRWEMVFQETYPFPEDVKRFYLEGNLIRSHRFCVSLSGRADVIDAAELACEAPSHAGRYTELLPFPVRFGAAENLVHFNQTLLEFPLPLANSETQALCLAACNARFAALEQGETLATKVHKELLAFHYQHPGRAARLEEIALRFYLSPRTLRRKLGEESTSFQRILGEVRRDLALHYLANTNLSAKEIAFTLGYSAVNNFIRAFKEWTGQRVTDVRRGTDGDCPEVDKPEPGQRQGHTKAG
jgi:AraC-like DNA-binding protein